LARYIELLFTVFAAKIAKRILDDGWPESVEEQVLLLLVSRQYIKDIFEADEKI